VWEGRWIVKIANSIHYEQTWRIHSLANDFHLEDVWQFPVEVEANSEVELQDFLRILEPTKSASGFKTKVSSVLFRIRERLGTMFAWDGKLNTSPIPGCSETTLRDRLSVEEQKSQPWANPSPVQREFYFSFPQFRLVYLFENEACFEISNGTLHALAHVSWVVTKQNTRVARMAVYVKTQSWIGKGYMKLISPFRHAIVYPAFMQTVAQSWKQHSLT
jgi:hypothetical protein